MMVLLSCLASLVVINQVIAYVRIAIPCHIAVLFCNIQPPFVWIPMNDDVI